MTALWLLSPQTPMFFQGQEFAASSPLYVFRRLFGQGSGSGRPGAAKFLSQFPAFATEEFRRAHPDPANRSTFERQQTRLGRSPRARSGVRLAQGFAHAATRGSRCSGGSVRIGSKRPPSERIASSCVISRGGGRRLGSAGDRQFRASSCSIRPRPSRSWRLPLRCRWELMWTSETVRYGGRSTPAVETPDGWNLPAETAVVLRAVGAAGCEDCEGSRPLGKGPDRWRKK